ncbi:heavy metal transporter [Streptomyces tropicalis]|uniref:Heavy metal transporter n=1 Tax=Streptomyces tropicalis TaxID=3034234 RepID=A0ABT6A0Q9_9ACTN|nr:heavy metal transporter [Streptomyces tropicalis]MDF3298053.1 heavy metal transporter [Streptomyces tropicalis]
MPEPSPTSQRRGRLVRIGAAVVVLLALAGYLSVQYLTGGTGAPGCKVVSGKGDGAAYELSPEQAVNAATISAVGTGRGMPERAVTIALATALQESGLRNIQHGDRDSLGLFQQRPSQGWGSSREIMDPTYAAGVFYEHLSKVPGYTRLPLTVAAQRVQRSGFPQAYAKHEPDATLLAAALTGRAAATLTCTGRPGATRAAGPDAVRAALMRDFGRDVVQEAGAEVGGDASPAPRPSGTPDVGDRAVTLPVSATDGGSARGHSARERGWQLAHWAVANASALHIQRIAFAGRVWTAGTTDGQWRPLPAQGAAGAEQDAGAVRILTAQ